MLQYSDGTEIETTWNHPFYIEGRGWVEVKDLEVGDLSLTSGDTVLEITDIRMKPAPQTVYNIHLDKDHTYFVTDSDVLVHNYGEGPSYQWIVGYLKQEATKRIPEFLANLDLEHRFGDAREAALYEMGKKLRLRMFYRHSGGDLGESNTPFPEKHNASLAREERLVREYVGLSEGHLELGFQEYDNALAEISANALKAFLNNGTSIGRVGVRKGLPRSIVGTSFDVMSGTGLLPKALEIAYGGLHELNLPGARILDPITANEDAGQEYYSSKSPVIEMEIERSGVEFVRLDLEKEDRSIILRSDVYDHMRTRAYERASYNHFKPRSVRRFKVNPGTKIRFGEGSSSRPEFDGRYIFYEIDPD